MKLNLIVSKPILINLFGKVLFNFLIEQLHKPSHGGVGGTAGAADGHPVIVLTVETTVGAATPLSHMSLEKKRFSLDQELFLNCPHPTRVLVVVPLALS